jgi:hypothetical protein
MESRTTLIWSIVIAVIIGWLIGHYAFPRTSMSNNYSNTNTNVAVNADKQIALYTTMRKLWSDHLLWTREYIRDSVAGLPSADAAAARLMKNQEDIGNAIVPYYGAQAGSQLTTLLKQHISIAVALVADAKANDQAKFKTDNAAWADNADQIAAFLSSANPNWPLATLKNMMAMHLSSTATELTAVINKQYTQSVTAFDSVFDHMMDMSDALSAGIIKQFPEKF